MTHRHAHPPCRDLDALDNEQLSALRDALGAELDSLITPHERLDLHDDDTLEPLELDAFVP